MMKAAWLLTVLVATAWTDAAAQRRPIPTFFNYDFSTHPRAVANSDADHPLVARCQERTRNATLDHFAWGDGGFAKFTQRYFVCDEYWKTEGEEKGPIFLYLGNEASVEKYIKATGLMWELAPEFEAMLVFIEHRYYGKSKPFGDEFMDHLEYLSVEQALGDFVEFLYEFQEELGGFNLPVIGFGGSYGGMLGSWMRMKYPHALHGVIASSAPIWSFMGEVPPANPNYFDQGKTYTASEAAGAAKHCVQNIRDTWDTIFLVAFLDGVPALKEALNLCPEVEILTVSHLYKIMYWIDHAITLMAEGSYNFPSDYMTDGVAPLPPYPIRLGCSFLKEPLEELELLKGVGEMVKIYYNVTQDRQCFPLEQEISEEGEEIHVLWGRQYCTEMFQMFGSDGVDDMMWESPWDPAGTVESCKTLRNVEARPYWATQQWGGKDISTASNIIFSNGEFDPWRGGGVQYNVSDTVIALIVKEGGHHADLMFSNDLDNDSLRAVRQFEKESIAKWIEEVREKNRKIKALMEEESPHEAPPSATAIDADSHPHNDRGESTHSFDSDLSLFLSNEELHQIQLEDYFNRGGVRVRT